MSDPLVIHVLETKFGLTAFSGKKRDLTAIELRKQLQDCIEAPSKINYLMSWRDTKQGHAFWWDYYSSQEPNLSEGRKILREAITMLAPQKPNEEYM